MTTCSPSTLSRFFQTLLQWIANTTQVESITYEGKTYEYQPEDQELKGDWKHTYFGTIVDLLHHPEKENLLKYNITHTEDKQLPANQDIDLKLWKRLNETKNWAALSFAFSVKVKLVNVAGINTDHRGADTEEGASLPYHASFMLPKTFTLGQLADAFYRIKSHKFDAWYELFTRVKVKCKVDYILLEVDFDHGS